MRLLHGLLTVATLMVVSSASSAYAACCGVSYSACEGCNTGSAWSPCDPTYTVMRTRRRVVMEPQQVTCYKNVYETVCEEKQVNCVRYERETHMKECTYTVCKPVRETHYRECTYTVCKPVWETKTKEICYTVCKPVMETRERVVCETICKPVHYTKEIQVCCGHWETQVTECPGPVVTKHVREPGCWTWDPCKCRCVYCPGECKTIQVQCPPRKICKKVWVAETKTKTINCVRYERETIQKTVPYTVCKMVPEQRVKTCTYKVCHMVKEQRVKTCTYKVCRMVPETRVKQIPYTTCRYETETRVKQVPYTVCKPVHYTKTVMVPKRICKRVEYTVTRCVPRVICEEVPVTVCCDPCRGGLLRRLFGRRCGLVSSCCDAGCESGSDCGCN